MTDKIKRKMGSNLRREDIIEPKNSNMFGLVRNHCSNKSRHTSDLSVKENQAYNENIERTRAETIAFALRMILTMR